MSAGRVSAYQYGLFLLVEIVLYMAGRNCDLGPAITVLESVVNIFSRQFSCDPSRRQFVYIVYIVVTSQQR